VLKTCAKYSFFGIKLHDNARNLPILVAY